MKSAKLIHPGRAPVGEEPLHSFSVRLSNGLHREAQTLAFLKTTEDLEQALRGRELYAVKPCLHESRKSLRTP